MRVPASTSESRARFRLSWRGAFSLQQDNGQPRQSAAQSVGMVRDAARKFFATAQCKAFEFSCDIRGDIPIARGLGSSVTVRLGVLHALNKIARTNLTRARFVHALCRIGRPCGQRCARELWRIHPRPRPEMQHFNVSPQLRFILLIPNFEIATNEARRLLPAKISRTSAVAKYRKCMRPSQPPSRRSDYERLRGCFVDYLHQPFRKN